MSGDGTPPWISQLTSEQKEGMRSIKRLYRGYIELGSEVEDYLDSWTPPSEGRNSPSDRILPVAGLSSVYQKLWAFQESTREYAPLFRDEREAVAKTIRDLNELEKRVLREISSELKKGGAQAEKQPEQQQDDLPF